MYANSVTSTARKLGLLYFLLAVLMILNETVISTGFVVPDDAAISARNIAADGFRYRLGILTIVVGQVLSVPLVIGLYNLFRDVDRRQAMLMLAFSLLGITIMMTTQTGKLLTISLLQGDKVLSVFTGPQSDAITHLFYKLRVAGNTLVLAFWGLWLFPFGILVIKSRMFPRVLGYALFLAGIGYVTNCVTAILWPEQSVLVSKFVMPLYFGELPIIFWMLIKGAKEPERLNTVSN